MLLNSLLEHSMIIVWPKEYTLNIMCLMYTPKNGLVESLIKRIKLIARPLLHKCNLPTSCWGHVVLHVADLIQLCPTAYHTTSPLHQV
jgi:hypothetical protein